MDTVFLSPYKPGEHEKDMCTLWEKERAFHPETSIQKGYIKKDAEVFTVVMPPPNVTGILHLGHTLEHALIDTRARYERLCGKRVLLIPGTDHAALATQVRVEKDIAEKEKIRNPREHYGREALLEKIRVYAENAKATIITQIQTMGVSCDWSRLAYTFDEKRSQTVRSVFKKMYDDGLIYRGHRIVNWDPALQTTVSDDEIVRKPEKSKFYYLKYGPFVIGTVRPETKFADKYVVMHPDDKRYAMYTHGQTLSVEWINGPVEATILKDEAVDPEFGTGVMTITPWHDVTDFEIAERHTLEKTQIIDWKGKLLDIAGEFAGMHITKARPLIVAKLQKKGLLESVEEEYENNLATNERGGGVLEPQIKEQWFVAVTKKIPHINKSLNELQREAISQTNVQKDNTIQIFPDHFKKVYAAWVNNPRDWCISRQIWWGHRIPVWYRKEEVYCGVSAPDGDGWVQDEDTLDTWFSSGTWSFSTLGQTDVMGEKTEDMKQYHPTSWIQMGYEILFLWMARMILMSVYCFGEIPFREVYIHGLVRDGEGKKFSKSLRNTIDPVTIVERYGADALRFSLLTAVTPGTDFRFYEDKVKHAKHFMNKVWNVARFVLQHVDERDVFGSDVSFSKKEKEYVAHAQKVKKEVGSYLEKSQYNLAVESAYEYVWHTFADQIIEESKMVLATGTKEEQVARARMLYEILQDILKLLHPFAPFITETIWQRLPNKQTDLLAIARWV